MLRGHTFAVLFTFTMCQLYDFGFLICKKNKIISTSQDFLQLFFPQSRTTYYHLFVIFLQFLFFWSSSSPLFMVHDLNILVKYRPFCSMLSIGVSLIFPHDYILECILSTNIIEVQNVKSCMMSLGSKYLDHLFRQCLLIFST